MINLILIIQSFKILFKELKRFIYGILKKTIIIFRRINQKINIESKTH